MEKEVRQQVAQQPPSAPDWKNEEFWSLMDKDPRAGLDYYFSDRFGMSPEDFRSTFEHTTSVASVAEQAMETSAFLNRVPDFPGGNEAAGAIMERLRSRDLPINANNMEVVYHELVREGQITPTSPAPQPSAAPSGTAPANPGFDPTNPTRPLPPPHLTPGGAAPPSEIDLARRAAGLSTAELEKLLRETGVKKY